MKHALQSLSLCLFCATLSLSNLSQAHAQFTYTYYPNDATLNNVVETDLAIVGYVGGSYDETDFSRHFTGPSSPTVEVLAGADISGGSNHGLGEMDIFNQSTVNASGGYVYAIVPFDQSTLNLTGSEIGLALSFDQSVINVRGGNVTDLEGQGKQINISGGTVGELVANVATDFYGNALGSCIVNVTGGEITGDASAFNDGILNLYGGKLGSVLRAAEGGTINIYGTDLTATLFNPSFGNGYSLYALSGTLEDGNVLNNTTLRVRNDGVTYGHSSFNLINAVPEPGSVALLLGIGVTGVSVFFRRRRCAQ